MVPVKKSVLAALSVTKMPRSMGHPATFAVMMAATTSSVWDETKSMASTSAALAASTELLSPAALA